MKTAVSIPDEVFEKVERLARRERRSRSEVFSAALTEYVARHAPDEVTEAMDRLCADVGDQAAAFVTAAGRQVLEKTEFLEINPAGQWLFVEQHTRQPITEGHGRRVDRDRLGLARFDTSVNTPLEPARLTKPAGAVVDAQTMECWNVR